MNAHFTSFLARPLQNSFFLNPVTEPEIIDHIKSLRDNKSSGFDNISNKVIKYVANLISKPLCHIFNMSFQNGIFPDLLKIAKVIPILKKDDPHTFKNYRPISLLPCFSKLLERLIYNRLIHFLTKHNVIFNRQYGFRKGFSTDLALIDIYDKLTYALQNNESTVGIFLDLSKAFDTINHEILLTKLSIYGIRGLPLKLLTNYLSNRQQFTSFNCVDSKMSRVICGIPQGSILGPLLFLLYVNDLPRSSKILKFILFADDSNIYFSHNNTTTLFNIINTELMKVSNWFKLNKLSLNIEKTNYIIFGRKRKLPENFRILIDNIEISNVDVTKFLGVTIDSNLTWKSHLNRVSNVIARNIGVINKLKSVFPFHILFTLYNTLVLPYLTYCNITWAITVDKFTNLCPWTSFDSTHIDKLFKLQKRALRICAGTSFLSHTKPLFHDFRALNIYDLNKLQTGLFMYRLHNDMLPSHITSLFSKPSSHHSHHTRSSQTYTASSATISNLRRHSILYSGPKLWNTLSLSLINKPSVDSFKHSYKRYLVSVYEE